jgi:protein-L-isoaspartate(D-aspartate) O-methyltransferase
MSHPSKPNRPSFPVRLDLNRPSFPAKLPKGMDSTAKSETKTDIKKEASIALKESDRAISDSKFFINQDRSTLNHEALRLAMVRKLQSQGIRHEAVLRAMRDTERHRFIDAGWASQSYEDTSLPIGYEQTISKPSVVARMLELLVHDRPVPIGRVLDIGTGCGYQAAVLSRVCTEVYSIERLKALHEKARGLLRPFRLFNLHLLLGDGMLGYAAGAPYSGIIAAAGGSAIPTVGGRLVAPVDLGGGKQSLIVIDRTAQGLTQHVLEAVQFVPLKSGVA